MKYYIELSLRYLEENGNVLDWLESYAKRNKIQIQKIDRFSDKYENQTEIYYRLIFKSENQLDYFVRIGNQNFPYFEFL